MLTGVTSLEGDGDELGERPAQRLRAVTGERRCAAMQVVGEINRRPHHRILSPTMQVVGWPFSSSPQRKSASVSGTIGDVVWAGAGLYFAK